MRIFANIQADALVLSLQRAEIRRDAQGLPTAMRLLAPGPVSITVNGQAIEGNVTPADITAILDYHRLKGELIPIDCEHLLQTLADLKGVEEADLISTEPLLGERAAAGMASLTEEDGALWVKFERWSDRARELLTNAGDAIYGYISPVIRGLRVGPLRITSLAQTNVPAINGQELLAAADPDGTRRNLITAIMQTQPGGSSMNWTEKLARLLSLDVAAFTAEGADLAPLIEAATRRVEQEAGRISSFLDAIRDAAALTAEDTLDTAAGKILSALEKARGESAALTELQTRVQGLEAKARERRIGELRAEGKLTEAMLPWARKQDMAALNDWAKDAPVIVQPRRLVDAGTLPADDDSLMLTAEDRAVAEACGLDPAAVAKANNLKIEA